MGRQGRQGRRYGHRAARIVPSKGENSVASIAFALRGLKGAVQGAVQGAVRQINSDCVVSRSFVCADAPTSAGSAACEGSGDDIDIVLLSSSGITPFAT